MEDLIIKAFYIAMVSTVAILNRFPSTDVIKVVRCKDCIYCDPENMHCDHPMGTAMPIGRKLDDFCSYGERRNGE